MWWYQESPRRSWKYVKLVLIGMAFDLHESVGSAQRIGLLQFPHASAGDHGHRSAKRAACHRGTCVRLCLVPAPACGRLARND